VVLLVQLSTRGNSLRFHNLCMSGDEPNLLNTRIVVANRVTGNYPGPTRSHGEHRLVPGKAQPYTAARTWRSSLQVPKPKTSSRASGPADILALPAPQRRALIREKFDILPIARSNNACTTAALPATWFVGTTS